MKALLHNERLRYWSAVTFLTLFVGFLSIVLANDKAKAADKGGATKSDNIFADAPVGAAKSWTGCYLRADTGMVAMNTKAGLETAPPAPVTIIELDGLGATGGLIGGMLGCDVQIAKTGLVIGAYAGYTKFYNVDWNLNILPATAAVNFSTALDNAWAIGARGGILVRPNVLAYVKVGYTQAEMASFAGSVGGVVLPGALSFPRFHGYEVGGGLEAALGGGWSLIAEATYAMYDAQSLAICAGCGVNLRVEPNTLEARIGAAYRFNFGQ